jgi:hypothetical protein
MLMYPGIPGSPDNHKKGYCADGVKQNSKTQPPAPWPQPQGIFTKGSYFNPIEFLNTLREVYESVVNGGENVDLSLEHEAFAKMVMARNTVLQNGTVLFKLFDLEMPFTTPDQLLVDHGGSKYLRLDCLRGD